MKVTILGAGLSGITTAYFLQQSEQIDEIVLLEKDDAPGGLCRSLHAGGYTYDIGPHILFSKDKEMLGLMLSVLKGKNDLKRSNQILYKDRWIQYPFENDLSKLPEEELRYCISAFNHNPYEDYDVTNMLQFFLKTFGEGITNTYLRPYNEKIWKYDPSFMDTSMVDRIPKPTKEDIRRSAAGETVAGYVHQLYFSYPAQGGIEAVVQGFLEQLGPKCTLHTNCAVQSVTRGAQGYTVKAGGLAFDSDLVVSTIPVQELTDACADTQTIRANVDGLRYNSIMIFFVHTKEDLCGANYAFMVPEKDVIFHRISKMDFLDPAYQSNAANYMVEVTYREHDKYDQMSAAELDAAVRGGICRIGFAKKPDDVEILNVTRHKYAYVIYDLDHSRNMQSIRSFYAQHGIVLNGRFGNFEYWNMDRILRESLNTAQRITGQQ